MYIKMILPALTEARTPHFRPIKYALFPPLGLATLASYCDPDDHIVIQDEHVETLYLFDEPDIVVIQVYITSAYRSYELADHYRRRGSYVCLGGLHVTSLPEEAAPHADSIFLGPGEQTWPEFLRDFKNSNPRSRYISQERSLIHSPPIRRDLIARERYLVPNSMVVSRGCPHRCDFCYVDSFFRGGRRFYTMAADTALSEMERIPGRHLFFLDDNIFADHRFAEALFHGLKGMGRVWQGAGTVESVMNRPLLKSAVRSGLRSLFIGFETLSPSGLQERNKIHNIPRDYGEVIHMLHDHGVMINASFVFGMDSDSHDVFDRTVEWAVAMGIETATFHILTPYPGTQLHARLNRQRRILSSDWDKYDTRHAVYRPLRMGRDDLEQGYWRAYKSFYSWKNIARSGWEKETICEKIRHIVYSGGWKKFELLWRMVVRSGLLAAARPILEQVLSKGSRERYKGS